MDFKLFMGVSLIVSLILFSMVVDAFSPRPPDQEKINLCKNTKGNASVISYSPYCGSGCDAAWATFVYCKCSDGVIWKDIEVIGNWTGCNTSIGSENENYVITESQFNEEMKIQGKQDILATITKNNLIMLLGVTIGLIGIILIIIFLKRRKSR